MQIRFDHIAVLAAIAIIFTSCGKKSVDYEKMDILRLP